MGQKAFAKMKSDYSETKKRLAIYKWGHKKSKQGLTVLYKDSERAKNKLEEETARRKK